MKERPILFSGPLVRALLAGTKTQTRRPVKDVDFRGAGGKDGPDWNDPSYWGWADEYGDEYALAAAPGVRAIPCPYGVLGTRLWVREAWAYLPSEHCHCPQPSEPTPCDLWLRGEGCLSARPAAIYRVDYSTDAQKCPGWRPSIYMPRWASRLTLEITDVRVQRLQDISEDDAKAEGVTPLEHIGADQPILDEPRRGRTHGSHPHVLAFACKWDDIYSETAAWVANPWVWALTFRVVR